MNNTDNSTADTTSNNTTTFDFTTKAAAFFDPTWQLAMKIEFYFQYAVIGIGIFGAAFNALVLYALISYYLQESKKRAVNLLMINQNLLDLSSCCFLVVTFAVNLGNIYMSGALGYFLCTVVVGQTATISTLNASIINLMTVTVERYLKVVHPFWSKRYLKRWMIYSAMVFAWICGTLTIAPVVFIPTAVEDGKCVATFAWESPEVGEILNAWTLTSYFVVPVVVFVYCYGRILVVMRRQIRVMAAHDAGGSSQVNAAQTQSKRVKWNVIKTMILVSVAFVVVILDSVAFVVCWFPTSIYFYVVDSSIQSTSDMFAGYYATLFLSYLYICMNPFIYAVKHEGVKEKLGRLVVWREGVRRWCGGGVAVAPESHGNVGDIVRGTQRSNTGGAAQTR